MKALSRPVDGIPTTFRFERCRPDATRRAARGLLYCPPMPGEIMRFRDVGLLTTFVNLLPVPRSHRRRPGNDGPSLRHRTRPRGITKPMAIRTVRDAAAVWTRPVTRLLEPFFTTKIGQGEAASPPVCLWPSPKWTAPWIPQRIRGLASRSGFPAPKPRHGKLNRDGRFGNGTRQIFSNRKEYKSGPRWKTKRYIIRFRTKGNEGDPRCPQSG